MRRSAQLVGIAIIALFVIGADDSGCSSKNDKTPTPGGSPKAATATPKATAPAATNTAAPAQATATVPAATATTATTNTVQFVEVNGAPAGGRASVVVQTQPNTECSLSYTTPAGTDSEADGLGKATSDASGIVRWEWEIGASTNPGQGSVRVHCGDASATNAIGIE